MEDWLSGRRLQCVNYPSHNTRTNTSTGDKSCPGLTVSTDDLADKVRYTCTTMADMGSDHLPILFSDRREMCAKMEL